MGDFQKFGKKGDTFNRGPGGRPSFGGGNPQFGGGDKGDRPMYKAVCAECGKPCEVPFKPSGDRPVYCKDCFAAMGPQDRGDRGPSNFQNRAPAPRQNFTPRPSFAPVQGSGEDKRLDDIKIQLTSVNSKLDRIITLLGVPTHATPKAVETKTGTLHDALTGFGAAPAAKKGATKVAVVSKKKSSKKK